jgi:hypothetical protein
MPAVSNAQLIAGFYAAIFNRAPDPSGLTYWEDQFSGSSSTIYTLAAGFTAHPVFTSTYGSMANLQFVQSIYQAVLGAAGDAEGIAYWTDKLNSGEGRSTMLADFVHDALTVDVSAFTNLTQTERDVAQARQDSLTNKVAVGLNFASTFGDAANLNPATDTTTIDGLASDPAYLASQAAIANVNSDPASVTTANAAIATAALAADPADALLHPTPPVPPAFAVTLIDGVASFANGSGDIVLHLDDSGIATFSRGTETSTTSVDTGSAHINVVAGQVLNIDASAVNALSGDLTGSGTVNVTGALTIAEVQQLSVGFTSGTLNYSLSDGDFTAPTILQTSEVAAFKAGLQAIVSHASNVVTLNASFQVAPADHSLAAYTAALATIDNFSESVVYVHEDARIAITVADFNASFDSNDDSAYLNTIGDDNYIVLQADSTSIADYQAAIDATNDHEYGLMVVFADDPALTPVSISVNDVDNNGYINALVDAGHPVDVAALSDSLNDYNDALNAIGNSNFPDLQVAAFAHNVDGITLSAYDYSHNADYVAALLLANDAIVVTARSDSYHDYVYAQHAIENGPAGSTATIAPLTLNSDPVTVSAAHYANTAYVTALLAAGDSIEVTPASFQLGDYNAAAALIAATQLTNPEANLSLTPFAEDATAVALTTAQFTSEDNAAYIAALEVATHVITVTPLSTAVGDYNAAVTAVVDTNATVAYVGTVDATAVSLSFALYANVDNAGYVNALVAASYPVVVNPASLTIGNYNAAVQAVGIHPGVTVGYALDQTAVTLAIADYTNPTIKNGYIAALESASHAINVTAADTTVTAYNDAVTATSTDSLATVVFPSSVSVIQLSPADFTGPLNTNFVNALVTAGHPIQVLAASTTEQAFADATAAAGTNSSVNASVVFATVTADTHLTVDYSDYQSAGYVTALHAAGYFLDVNPADTTLDAYNTAKTAIAADTHAAVKFATANTPVDVNVSDFSNGANAAYVAALKLATHPIVVNPTDTTLDAFTTAYNAIGGASPQANVSVGFPALSADISISLSDFSSATGYFAALDAAATAGSHTIIVNPAGTTLAEWNDANVTVDGDAEVAYAQSSDVVTMITADYTSGSTSGNLFVSALGIAGHPIHVTPLSTSQVDYAAAKTAIGINTNATAVYVLDVSAVNVSTTDFNAHADYVAALQAATHAISIAVTSDFTAAPTVVNASTGGTVTLNVTGSTAAIVDLHNATGAHGFTIDASTNTHVGGVTITGSAQDDIIIGTAGDDTLNGGGGNDTFYVAGSDTITGLASGGTLNVAIGATATSNLLDYTGVLGENSGTVVITGTGYNDTIVGTLGHDVITSQGGTVTVGEDATIGTHDTVNLLAGAVTTITDLHYGDTLNVAAGAIANVSLANLSGSSIHNSGIIQITGTALDDVIYGSAGQNVIIGGVGADTMTGGAAKDTFKFANGDAKAFTFTDGVLDNVIGTGDTFNFASGTDVITNFASGTDKLSIEGVNIGGAGYVNGASPLSATPPNGSVFLVHGNYNTSTGAFSVTTAGNDTLAIYDNSVSGTGSHVEGIVLSGVTNLVPLTDMVA